MDRKEALEYINIAAENRIKQRTKYTLDNDSSIGLIKADIEYYEEVMEYIEENLK